MGVGGNIPIRCTENHPFIARKKSYNAANGRIFGEDDDDTMSFEEVVVSDDYYSTLLNDKIRKGIK